MASNSESAQSITLPRGPLQPSICQYLLAAQTPKGVVVCQPDQTVLGAFAPAAEWLNGQASIYTAGRMLVKLGADVAGGVPLTCGPGGVAVPFSAGVSCGTSCEPGVAGAVISMACMKTHTPAVVTGMLSTAALMASVGINAHPQNSPFDPAPLIAAMKTLGITVLRSRVPPDPARDSYNAARWATLGASGQIKRMIVTVTNDTWEGSIAGMVGVAKQFMQAHWGPGQKAALVIDWEGPNEPQNTPLTYGGFTDSLANGWKASQLFWADCVAQIRADPFWDWSNLYAPSWLPSPEVPVDCTAVSVHSYAQGNIAPSVKTASLVADARLGYVASQPWIATELGASDASPSVNFEQAFDAATAAKLLLETFAACVAQGGVPILYEAIDDQTAPFTNWVQATGMFNHAGAIKPMGQAIANLMQILSGSTAPVSPDTTTVFAAPAGAQLTALQRDAVSYDLLVWNEPNLWNISTQEPVTPTPLSVSVALPFTASLVQIYDPLLGTVVETTLANVAAVPVTLTGNLLLVRVHR